MRVSLHTILRNIVLTKQQQKKTTGSWGTTNSTRASSSGTTEETYYPTERAPKRDGDEPGSPNLLQNPFVHDPAYIKRYRDPSKHDSYQIPDHHHPIPTTSESGPPPLRSLHPHPPPPPDHHHRLHARPG
ncbi:hypothetical protein PCANC_26251 [Puccinia coronata f. sp. avenae]|uniref:Uncharacterized protein n=1 Tax=Puccinia coronata f. sp. avenae TaxID=200324 RepID=A0A2N5S4F7_9BASI|nr:hypothetical protein PCANC_26251 [Puccinia coronata f. sp. avenae]